jgi:hypothetical protein
MANDTFLARTERFLPIAIFAAFSVWYALDAHKASGGTENLIMILPAATVVLLSLIVLTVREIRDGSLEVLAPVPLNVLGLMAALVVYISAIGTTGIDLSSFVFAVVTVRLLGERRLWSVLLFAAILTGICVLAFSVLITTPLPLSPLWPR